MNYVLVENGSIVKGPCVLPQNWMNISGFNLIQDQSTIISYGWYPYTFVPYVGDMSNKVVINSIIEITETECIEYQQVRDKTPEEMAAETESKWENIRSQRNVYLKDSDWTQLGDVQFTPDIEMAWKNYRKALRDITDFPTPDQVVWPDPPPYSPVVQPTGPIDPIL